MKFFLMNDVCRFAVASVISSLLIAPLLAAPLTINGATFDAPAACKLAEGAMVCKLDGQQLELWVYRKPVGIPMAVAEREAKRAQVFSEFHDGAVSNIIRSTGNDRGTPFSAYGRYAVVGAAMAGKGDVKQPSIHIASLLSGDEMWQFVEVVATRTPAIEVLAGALQRSLLLPVSVAAVALVDSVADTATSATQTFTAKLATFQYPNFLLPVVSEDSATVLNVGFKHKARDGGPNVTLSVRTAVEKGVTAATANAKRRTQSTGVMAPGSAAVDVKKLGSINGTGYALLGTPDAAKGFSGIESIETAFAADVDGRLLEVRLTGEQKYSSDVEQVWLLLSKSLKLIAARAQ
jgi:hypothetical protein